MDFDFGVGSLSESEGEINGRMQDAKLRVNGRMRVRSWAECKTDLDGKYMRIEEEGQGPHASTRLQLRPTRQTGWVRGMYCQEHGC